LTDKISLIIPLRLTANTFEGELRLRRICDTVPRDLFDILISDYGTEDAHAGPLRALEAEGVAVVRHPSPKALFSIGDARDFGVRMARGKVVLFNDIDFFGTPDMYRAIHAEATARDIARNMFDFFCVPVLFLTEEGTQAWFGSVEADTPFVAEFSVEWTERAVRDVQFAAFGSSAMVVNRHHYLSLGGHDPNFSGHGAEDYDLLHRLASLAPKGPRPNDYFTDFKDNGVRTYWGFRACFALHGLDVFAHGVHLVHLWHPRRMEKGYFRSRPNFRHLKRVMRRFDRAGQMPLPLTDSAGEGTWLVVYRSAQDIAMLRQILPLAHRYELLKARTLPPAHKLAAMAAERNADRIVLAPDASAERARLEGEAALAGIDLVQLRHAGPDGACEVTFRPHAGAVRTVVASAEALRSDKGKVIYRGWHNLDCPGLGFIESGDRPRSEPLSSPIFASFGGESLLDRTLHPRPARKKKSTLWVKLKRRLTGY
jgi:predicted glycosyltransferase involved in capsule biosynthesis